MTSDADSKREPGEGSSDDRLDSWKEIAAYLGRGVTTVQRWEIAEGLPVQRLPHAKKGSVFAFKRDLDAWRTARAQMATRPAASATADTSSRSRMESPWLPVPGARATWIAASLAFLLLALGVVWAVERSSHKAAAPSVVALPAPRPLANDSERESSPSVSPDGKLVVYSWKRKGEPGLYIKPVAGGEPHRLPLDDGKKFSGANYPQWSPRGDVIAFLLLERPDVRGVYVVPATGGSPRYLTSMTGIGLCWNTDGRSVAFNDRSPSGDPFSFFSISLATGDRTRLTTPPAGSFGDLFCSFSPDGKRLAVSRYLSRSQSDLFVVDATGEKNSTVERVTYGWEGSTGVDWSPDGRTLVFGSESGLWKVAASSEAGVKPVSLVGSGIRAEFPSFSRPRSGDNAVLVYEHNIQDVNIWRWIAEPAAGASMQRLVESSTWWEDHPAFSPDGRHIAFTSNRTGANEIFTADADGSNTRQLTFHGGPMVVQPQWSPDGQHLAFVSETRANRDIYVIQANGSSSTRLTWEPTKEEYPSWSRDGRWIYFSSDRGGISQIWKMPAAGGAAIRVTSGQATQGFESPDGKLLYFVRSPDVPGVWSVPVEGGNESFVVADASEAYWGVADTGIAFLVASPERSPSGPTIQFYDFVSRKVRVLAALRGAGQVLFGFAVARDARSVLWTQRDRSDSDVMMFDPWRP